MESGLNESLDAADLYANFLPNYELLLLQLGNNNNNENDSGVQVFVTTTPGWNESEVTSDSGGGGVSSQQQDSLHNWWAMLAVFLVLATAAGNILVCLAIAWERRLQNVTNYFLMSLAITDLMVAILVMPLGIVTLVRGNCVYTYIYTLYVCLALCVITFLMTFVCSRSI